MNREAESKALAFCHAQQGAFDPGAWARFDAVDKLELCAIARYLAGVDWYGHREMLARIADQITSLSFEELSQRVDFDPTRFKVLLQTRLDHAKAGVHE